MSIQENIVAAALSGVKELYGAEVPEKMIQLQETRPEFEGELTLVVFPLLKTSKKAPEATAQDLGAYLAEKCPELISKFNVVKGFLNLSVAPEQWIKLLEEIEHSPKFGFVPVTEESPLVMIEYSSPNTNKPLHLGHVRNNLLG